MAILEIQPGAASWWTEILAPYAKRTGGKLYVTGADLANPNLPESAKKSRAAFEERYGKDPALYGKIEVINWGAKSAPLPKDTFDFILTARSVHGWMGQPGMAEKVFKEFYDSLKPGGILALEQHRANPGPQDPKAASGYVTEQYVIELAEKAGFKLAGTLTAVTFTKGDMNNDGQTDLLLRALIPGDVVAWLMNGTTRAGEAALNPVPFDPNDELVGVDDFDSDRRNDVAVIQILDEHKGDWPAAALGDSDDLEVGELVIAIGSPFELASSVSYGVVSATGRTGVGRGNAEDFIQTDAALNPGNSGGPLINLDGQVVGINTAIQGATGANVGIGFSIPINLARTVAIALIEKGEARRGWLGVHGVQLSADDLEREQIDEHTLWHPARGRQRAARSLKRIA